MAITLPSNLYAGEAERFNSMPHVQFQTQLLAKRKAKEDALDEYYKTLPTKINDKGVRDNEREIISKGVGDLQDFWMKNRAALKNPKLDNGATQLAYEKMYRDLHNVVGQSQTAGKEGLDFGKEWWKKENEYLHHDNDVIGDLAAWELPVTDPNHKSLSLTRLSKADRPFDVGDYIKDLKEVKYDEGVPSVQAHPTNKYFDVETPTQVLSESSKDKLAKIAATRYENDWSFKKQIDKTLAKDPNELSNLVTLFKDNYGRPIETDHDLATAYSLSILPKGEIKTKLIPNDLKQREAQQRGFEHQEKMARIRKADAKDLISFRDNIKGQDEENEWVERYVNVVADENKPQPTKNWLGQDKTPETKMFKPDQVLYKALGDPSKTEITKDGNYKLTYVKKIKNGDGDEVEVIDGSRSGVFTPEQVKLALGYKATTKKALAKEMNPNAPTQKATPSKSTSIKVKTSKPERVQQDGVNYILNDNGEYEPE